MEYQIKIEKTIKLSGEDMEDILCSAFEGGCGYWCCIDNSTAEWKKAKTEVEGLTLEGVMLQLMTTGRPVILIDEEDNDKVHELTMDKFIKGIQKTIENEYWDGNDVSDVDGNIGDVIIQYALFDEVVYG